MQRKQRTTWLLAGICAAVWVWSGIQPEDRLTWGLEQIASVLVIAALLLQRGVRYSTGSLAMLAVLFCAHTAGTHYTYSLTPYDAWFQALTGQSLDAALGWQRNNYDRVVHFLWGLCMTQPMLETLEQRLRCTFRASANLSFHVVLSTSALYELLEWAAAVMFGEGGQAYLGTQGDVWDAQADIAIALAGWALVILFRLVRGAAPAISARPPDG
ncbi:MAG: DUF2238 domain-containing protein [Pseudomonadales bacterium]|nr:DUF2238 domain-containing protein [Pseudomonadales bacterium]